MEECLTPLEKLSLEYSRDPVGVTQRELTTLTNLGSQENLALDIAVEQRDLTKEMHYSMMQLAELTKRIVDMNEIAANSAEKTTSLTLLIYILTAASIVIGLAGLGIDTATAIIPAESPDLPAVVISIWAGGIIVTIVLTLIMVFCLPKRKKNSKAQLPKSP